MRCQLTHGRGSLTFPTGVRRRRGKLLQARPSIRKVVTTASAIGVVAALLSVVPIGRVEHAGASTAAGSLQLEPDLGQYVPIEPVDIYDTRGATIGGAPTSIGPGASETVAVVGFTPSGW